jgi:hypothetical protein
MNLAGTFDIECADWDRFVVGATYEGEHQAKIHRDPDSMIDHMRKRGGVWMAHAGGIYDGLLVADRLRRRGIKFMADESQQRISRLVCGGTTLRDSYALFPFPLDELAGALGRKVPSLPWSCKCGRACGGYCRIAEKCKEGDPDLEDYCVDDCRVLFDGMHELAAFAADNRIMLKGTIGSTAWATAQHYLGLPDASYPSWDVWRRIRAADKGGRLAIIRPHAAGPGSHSDIVNAYPGALARAELPVGAFAEYGGRRARQALEACLPGIYSLTVHVPEDCFLPPLPWRIGGRVVYPTGTFGGSWTLPELVAAFERGTRVVDVASAIVWEATAPIFSELLGEWYALRRRVGKSSPFGRWVSGMSKALCGKLAEGPEKHRILVNPDKIKMCRREKGCRNGCTGRCRRYEQIDLWGSIWSAPYWKQSPSGHVEWSAYLRAHTRIQLLTEMEKFGRAELVYVNTDSIWSTGRRLPSPISDELGQWERKHGWSDWECRAPNVYRVVGDDGTPIIRAAGSPSVSDTDWMRGGGVLDRGVTTFRKAAKSTHGLFQQKHRRWTLPEHSPDGMYGDRKLAATDGVTYPLTSKQWRELYNADNQGRKG